MRERKNFIAALFLCAALLAASIPARAESPARGVREAAPRTWVVRILGWIGLHPQGLGSIWASSSANIDPDGQPMTAPGGGTATSTNSDSSANIDPNG